MAKKTENELRSILQNRDKKRVVVSFDKGQEGGDLSGVWLHDREKKVVDEISSYKGIPEKNTEDISKSNFKAYFENKELPQNDEISAVEFMQDKDADILYVRITFTPKKSIYWNLLINDVNEEPFVVELNNKNGITVDKFTIYLKQRASALNTPIVLKKHKTYVQSFIEDDTLSYEVDFDFLVED